MLTVYGKKYRLCDGATRRDFLRIGSLAIGGMTLPQLLSAEAQAGVGKSHKAIIMIYMAGAPPHQDMYDLKMDAPAEIRGPFQPIETSVLRHSGFVSTFRGWPRSCISACRLRSVYGSPNGAHDSYICYTGRAKRNEPTGGWPSAGSMVSKLKGPAVQSRAAVHRFGSRRRAPAVRVSPALPGFLGVSHAAFRPSGPAQN